MRVLWVAVLWGLLCAGAVAVTPQEVANPRARDGTWVTDMVVALRPDTVKALNARASDLKKRTGAELAVAVVPDTGTLASKAFATALFNCWGIGRKGVNDGVLLLVVPSQRRVEIEVGDGARRLLTDAVCARILTADVVPAFKRGDLDGGVLAGVDAMVARLAPPAPPAVEPSSLGHVVDQAGVVTEAQRKAVEARLARVYRETGVLAVCIVMDQTVTEENFTQIVVQALMRMTPDERGQKAQIVFVLGKSSRTVYHGHGGQAEDISQRVALDRARALAAKGDWKGTLEAIAAEVETRTKGQQVGRLSSENPTPAAAPPVRAPAPAAPPPPPPAPADDFPVVPMAVGGGALTVALALTVVRGMRRRRPRTCPSCGTRMDRLGELADDSYLQPGQVREESLGSVDYDVWLCPRCQATTTEGYRAWLTSLADCPSCGYRTVSSSKRELQAATTFSEGHGEESLQCHHCTYSMTRTYTIARVSESSSSSSSASSSDASSSFGGGSSSGGGAGASW